MGVILDSRRDFVLRICVIFLLIFGKFEVLLNLVVSCLVCCRRLEKLVIFVFIFF